MKNLSKNKRALAIVGVIVALIAIIAYVWQSPRMAQTPVQQGHGNASGVVEDNTPTDAKSQAISGSSPSSAGPAPEAPLLQKSSGNNGSIPMGAVVEFICNTKSVISCTIILTDKVNASHTIDLGYKNTEDARGQYGASWTWNSLKGSWSVVARTKNGSGKTADSAAQLLEVQ